MTVRWQVDPDAAPSIRSWGGEVVVHHALANDTHRLSAAAGQLLTELVASTGGPQIGFGQSLAYDDPQAKGILLALAELGLVVRC